ncbi:MULTISPECIES: YqaE/Pmp3 family membrane protein [Idiomarina]|jgi:uncharacterized membrane protein YqaE (UPF0057 family)|uniref:YqaE/Pmp3 family membrane protein n=2 Tax=Idiomarina baltica TaxID=190892 RepID=A0A348WNB4_9GAMM|nr:MULTISPECIES: YqaE/Pmp3 family membrane protein [Idiomarina]MAD53242.1 YqaE/Pmp3 family membrane protein [Idiomarinaceae bacterium]MEC7643766.1 YqaE/Pmp3 family membrane protein [Pseudomonadota bacterium]HAR56026.1 YqaE/Pmp3 family membrane protein [Idiomarina baltica]EAQ32602.1 Uncharacterized conserved membrane protein [Idiomarina baltica OS145]KXS34496.1 MAG: hypothetical protein AWU56_1923 [Idiomarina sp. T82-3]|tara:strand:- start:3435 stop:3671 length:237 start_codon:yes stop_codon:yes gene_type:complete
MRYILAVLIPPLAVLTTGRIFQFLFNVILTALGIVLFVFSFGALGLVYILAIIHAILVVRSYNQDKRDERLVRAVRGD